MPGLDAQVRSETKVIDVVAGKQPKRRGRLAESTGLQRGFLNGFQVRFVKSLLEVPGTWEKQPTLYKQNTYIHIWSRSVVRHFK